MNSKNCVVITTINPPTPAILKYIAIREVDVIIVADTKTPDTDYKGLNCRFLSLKEQHIIAPAFDKLLPFNHYARKNIGYLYAIKNGYKTIIDTDDDNIPYDNWSARSLNPSLDLNALQYFLNGPKIVNIYKLFTNIHIWPRGLPLSRVLDKQTLISETLCTSNNYFDDISIIQGLADGDPDVDAIYRLTARESLEGIFFEKKDAYYKLSHHQYCPANTQNTIWRDQRDFHLLYIPSYVSFRFCDILKMYIAQSFVRRRGRHLAFQGATVFQDRNPHNYFKDYLDECEMYVHVDRLINLLDEFSEPEPEGLYKFYSRLVNEKIIKDSSELPLLEAWLAAIN